MKMDENADNLLGQYTRTLSECRSLYVQSGQFCASDHPELIPDSPAKFVRLMDDLHRGLVVKTYLSVIEADHSWSNTEKRFGQELVLHLWGKLLDDRALKETVLQLSGQATSLKWYGLVRPFVEIEPLRDKIGQLETLVIRNANLVAKADGHLSQQEANVLHSLQGELDLHLRAIPYADYDHSTAQQLGSKAVAEIRDRAYQLRPKHRDGEISGESVPPAPPTQPPRLSLIEAKSELDGLIGLEGIKQEVQSLINYLQLQQKRAQAGLPATPLSLHSIFTGNPGTGKTTVARIVGKILGSLGILNKGHVIETDRSGLVAEFAGQTGPKTNKKIDEAIDGILFIDEAYTLIAEGNEDPYGHEAVQTLLKRMEDDRERLVVVLAGYPEPIERLLDANPGLRSRFSRRIHFDDYDPVSLGRIMGRMCQANEYKLPAEARSKFLLAVHHVYSQRDEHFGNGRLVRNIFEDAIRRLANRIADIVPITTELLTTIDADDIDVPGVPEAATQQLDRRFRVSCPACAKSSEVPTAFLSRRVECPCGKRFVTDWGEVVATD